MRKNVLKAALRVLAGTIFFLALAATVGIPTDNAGSAAAQKRNPDNSCIQP